MIWVIHQKIWWPCQRHSLVSKKWVNQIITVCHSEWYRKVVWPMNSYITMLWERDGLLVNILVCISRLCVIVMLYWHCLFRMTVTYYVCTCKGSFLKMRHQLLFFGYIEMTLGHRRTGLYSSGGWELNPLCPKIVWQGAGVLDGWQDFANVNALNIAIVKIWKYGLHIYYVCFNYTLHLFQF